MNCIKGINKNILVWLVCLLYLIYTGCSNFEQSLNKNIPKDINELNGSADDCIIVQDCIGRKLKVPRKVKRIACLYAFSSHVVTMLGRGQDMVAVVEGVKRDKLINELVPGMKDVIVPYSSGAINIEELMNARPDIALIKTETAKSSGEITKLEKCSIPYLVVDYKNMCEQMYAIKMIADAIGMSAKGDRYNESYKNVLDFVKKRIEDIPMNKKKRVYHSVNEATRTDAKGDLGADWLNAAGAVDVSVNEELKFFENKYFASLEQILLWNPEYIIANEAGVKEYILSNEQWKTIQAVQNRLVYQMPVGISRWGHPGSLETPLALIWTAKLLYPEKFKDIDLDETVKKFYNEYFNLNLSIDEVHSILEGKGMRSAKNERK